MKTLNNNPIIADYPLVALIAVWTTILIALAIFAVVAFIAATHRHPEHRRDARIVLSIMAELIKSLFSKSNNQPEEDNVSRDSE